MLVTGGSGFIGTNIVQHYLDLGADVANFDIAPPRNRAHAGLWRPVDLLDSPSLAKAVGDYSPQLVFHMAARTDLEGRSLDDYAANIAGVENLVDALLRLSGLQFAVFASSMLVCRIGYQPVDEFDYRPGTPYGESKALGEQIVRRRAGSGFPWLLVRPTSIWGPWFGSPYRDFFMAVRRGLFAMPGGVRVLRSYGFVLNSVAQLARMASQRGERLVGQTVYLADYEPLDLLEWAGLIRSEMGSPRIRTAPLWLFESAAKVGDLLKRLGYRTPPMTSFRLNNLLTEMIVDMSRVEAACGPLPHTARDGVRITCEWMRAAETGR